MGYACPVCGDPQADDEHLANHLAFTALTSGGDHEDWLDEHVPDWEQLGEDGLAERVVDRAEETEYPQVFEESGVEGDPSVDLSAARERGSADPEVAGDVLEEARRMSPDVHGEDADGDGDAEGETE